MKLTTGKRALALLLCLCIVYSAFSGGTARAVAADNANGFLTGLCEHHPVHTDKCGYVEGVEGHPCGHLHSEDCFELVCAHTHTDECYSLTDKSPADENEILGGGTEQIGENFPDDPDNEKKTLDNSENK